MNTWKKKTNNYSAEQLLLNEPFITWVLGGKPNNHPWSTLLIENPSLLPEAEKAEVLILQLDAMGIKEDHTRIESLKKRIDYRIEGVLISNHPGGYPQVRPGRKRYVWLAAASLTLLTVIGLAFRYYNLPTSHFNMVETYEVRNTKNGQKLIVHLNDGSKVKLNSGSSIRYQKYFSDTSRVIFLEGEAFFEVARDSSRPFRVVAGHTVTEALGTSFNINNSSAVTHIALVTGKVLINSSLLKDQQVLVPGQMVSSLHGQIGAIQGFGYEEIAWKDDILLFSHCIREEVFTRLEKWYGVQFKFEGNFARTWNYSGKFNNQALKAVLMSIGHSEEFEFEIQNKEVVIRPN